MIRVTAIAGVAALAGMTGTSPADDETNRIDPSLTLNPVVIIATRSAEPAFETPYMTDVVGREQLERRQYRTTPQALRDVPGVMAQETGVGQGSPYIRGFTSQRTVLLIDGIRLNNSVFREGPNQYWATVDSQSVDRFEVVKGPSSVLYGSDAIGGTVNAITIDPYAYGRGVPIAGRGYYRYGTGEDSNTGRGELSFAIADDRFGALFGGTLKDFGTMTAGRDVHDQPNTDYDEYDYDLKGEYFVGDDARLVVLYQKVRINNAPRTHRTFDAVFWEGTGPPGTGGSAGSPNIREDFDQERELAYVQFHAEQLGEWIEQLSASVSYQRQSEVRDRVRPGTPLRRDMQGFDVDTLGLWANAVSPSPIGRWTYGFEYYHDWVSSFSSSDPIQGPVGDDAAYDLLGLYVQNEYRWHERVKTVVGGRFTYAAADARSVNDGNDVPVSVSDHYLSLVGSGRLLVAIIPDHLNAFGGISQGFRAPNLMDLTANGEFGSGATQVGSADLDPENFVSYEVGLKARDEAWQAEVAYFYTDIEDLIVRAQRSMGAPEYDAVNAGDGYINGIEAGAAWRLLPELTLFGNLTWQEGKVERPAYATGGTTSRAYISRLAPLSGQVGLRYDAANLPIWIEGLVRMAERQDMLASNDEIDNRIPPGGTPGYVVASLRGGWRIDEHWQLLVAVENVTDEDYRIHGSGQNMPGVNLIVGVEGRF